MKRIELRELKPLDWQQRHYIRGNIRTFGFWGSIKANITLMSPLLNMILNWKYRDWKLTIGE